VLAKETSMLAMLSRGRFELGIGAGDYFEEMHAWGVPVPKATERIEGLRETIQVLRRIWTGEAVTFEGKHLHIHHGLCVPAPETAPRVVVGIGSSRRLLHSAVEYADEDLMREARSAIDSSGRDVTLSTFVWDWRDDTEEKLKAWEQLGVERTFITFWEPFDKLAQAAHWMQ
jgi:alkanesulfonate monooxygenase SsuD/methylene tetrahydromethanopterin reductase-like flavin-dependent oxidoreductase (luciferase family)